MRVAAIVARTALFVAYPFLLYLGIRSGQVRALGLGTAAMALLLLASTLRAQQADAARALLSGPIMILLLGVASAVSRDPRFVLAMPVLVNGALLAQFGSSLAGTPIVERFARMIDGELSEAQVRYCRTVTWVWCGFFFLNGAIAGVLAVSGAIEAWTLHAGLLGYVGMGLLGGGEYVVRKLRFRKFADHFVDRALRRLITPRGDA